MSALRELLGLFVDDGSLAVAIVGLIALAALVLPMLALSSELNAFLFYGACLVLLVENVTRKARRP